MGSPDGCLQHPSEQKTSDITQIRRPAPLGDLFELILLVDKAGRMREAEADFRVHEHNVWGGGGSGFTRSTGTEHGQVDRNPVK